MGTSYQNLWDTARAVLLGKFKTTNAYIKKKKINGSQTTTHYSSRN
jgi:hypothetical protein